MFYAKVKASKQLRALKGMFPSYKGRTVVLRSGETARIHDYWDEGCRAYPVLFEIGTLRHPAGDLWGRLFTQQPMPYSGMVAGSLRLEPGIGLAEHVYSGSRQYLRVTLHPSEDKSEWIG